MESKQTGGNFFFYPYKKEIEKYVLSKSEYNSAILVDGTHVVHGVERYMPEREHPPIEKNVLYYVAFNKSNNIWGLYDSKNNVLKSYKEEDIRISLVWRVHCFNDEKERQAYHDPRKNAPDTSIEKVLDVLSKAEDMHLKTGEKKLDYFVRLIEKFGKYPNKGNSYLNYCLLPLMMPKILNDFIFDPILSLVC